MGWDNPPVPWRELQRRMSWRTKGSPAEGSPADGWPAEDRPIQHRSRPSRAVLRRAGAQAAASIPWAELHCHSSYSFLDGAATPDELVTEAARLGLEVLALTDHDGMYGVPQFAQAAARLRDQGVKLGTVFGAELSVDLPPGPGGQGGEPDPAGRHLL